MEINPTRNATLPKRGISGIDLVAHLRLFTRVRLAAGLREPSRKLASVRSVRLRTCAHRFDLAIYLGLAAGLRLAAGL